MGGHIVVVAPPTPGHVYPTLPLIEELVARGHRVSYVVGPDLAPVVQAAGAAVVDLGWRPDTAKLADCEFTIDTLAADIAAYIAAAGVALPRMLDQLGRDVPNLICCDSVVLGPLLAAVFGAPIVSLVPTFATNAHFAMAELVPGFDPTHPAFAALDDQAHALFTSYGVGPLAGPPPVSSSLVFVPKEFQIAGDTFDDSFHFIGPTAESRARGEWQPPNDHPLVLVSLGTAFNNRPEFFASAAEAFADSRWQVVMAVGEHVTVAQIGRVPPNVAVTAQVPQLAVLRRARAFVTHAGMGSTMEALYHRVPIVAVPHVREQAVIARRVQELGLGRHLDRRAVSAEALRGAVEQVDSDPAIRTRLAAMRRAIDDAGGARAGADVIEALSAPSLR